jgi:hypothetical protein
MVVKRIHLHVFHMCTPLSSYPLAVVGNSGGSSFECSNWVVQLAAEIHWLVGVSCEGFEGQFLVILIAIEAEERHR